MAPALRLIKAMSECRPPSVFAARSSRTKPARLWVYLSAYALALLTLPCSELSTAAPQSTGLDLNFPAAARLFRVAEHIDEETDVVGDWRIVAMTRDPATARVEYFAIPEQVDFEGLRQNNIVMGARFDRPISAWELKPRLGVTLTLGGEPQGPYVARIQDGSVHFSTEAYRFDGPPPHFAWSCRKAPHSRLICAIAPMGRFPDPAEQRFVGQIVGYAVLDQRRIDGSGIY